MQQVIKFNNETYIFFLIKKCKLYIVNIKFAFIYMINYIKIV